MFLMQAEPEWSGHLPKLTEANPCDNSGQCTIPGGKVSQRCMGRLLYFSVEDSSLWQNKCQIAVFWTVDFCLAVHMQPETLK